MTDIEKAAAVLQGLSNRDAALAIKYVDPERYIEHNPHASDGIVGLTHYVEEVASDNPNLKLVRAFQDGPYNEMI